MFDTRAPFWFGPTAPLLRLGANLPGIRTDGAISAPPVKLPVQNGWHYQAPDSRMMVEAVGFQVAATHFEAWNDLILRTLEPNIFLDPCFILPAVQHFALARRPSFLLVWDETNGARDHLLGLCPVMLPRRLFGNHLASAWMHAQAALGTPLIDRARGIETLDLMLDWLRRENRKINGLMIPFLRHDGPVLALLRDRAVLTGRELQLYNQHERAMLSGGDQGKAAMMLALSPKRLSKLRRQRRRLAATGKVEFHTARTPDEVRRAAELFLAMEAAGWKGKRGTALLANASLTTFTRTMTRLLARDGKCRILSLRVGGKAVAMGIILESGGYAYIWKVAYDETFKDTSPGVQFILDMTRLHLADEGIIFTDSCAIPNHPMINHVWRERLAMTDALISARPEGAVSFAIASAREKLRRNLRGVAKALVYKLTNRKRS